MKLTNYSTIKVSFALLSSAASSQAAFIITPVASADGPAELVPALLAPSSGISILPGTISYTGVDSQAGTFTGSLPGSSGSPDITQDPGILLTNGTAVLPDSNTDTSFDPVRPGTGSDPDLASLSGVSVNDVNVLEFDFTTNDPNADVVLLDFIFGSDEFPDQSVTDVFGVFVDGTNYAFFPDGSLVSFVTGVNAVNFNDNSAGNYPIEYDGLSNSLNITALLDPTATEHTMKIAIGDTSDSIFDSGAFLSNLRAANVGGAGGSGGVQNPPPVIPEPSNGLTVCLLGVFAFVVRRRS